MWHPLPRDTANQPETGGYGGELDGAQHTLLHLLTQYSFLVFECNGYEKHSYWSVPCLVLKHKTCVVLLNFSAKAEMQGPTDVGPIFN